MDVGAAFATCAPLGALPAAHWPPAGLVSWLVAEAAKHRRLQIDKPFIYVDLAKHAAAPWVVPPAAGGKGAAREEEAEGRRFLPWEEWTAAFVSYALAAQAADQWELGSSLGHLANCLRLSHDGRRGGSGPVLGIAHDALARKRWSEWSLAGLPGFKIAEAAARIDWGVAKLAEGHVSAARRAPEGNGGGKAKGGKGKDREKPGGKGAYTHGKGAYDQGKCDKRKAHDEYDPGAKRRRD